MLLESLVSSGDGLHGIFRRAYAALGILIYGPGYHSGASAECEAKTLQIKLSDNSLYIFIFVVFCNIMIYIAVENDNHHPHETCKYLALFLGAIIFILCGFEHCVANMFYFSLAGAWSGTAVYQMFFMTFGNTIGGLLLPITRSWIRGRT